MRAKLFFDVLNKGKKIDDRRRSHQLLELCDIATVSMHPNNYKIVRKHLMDSAFPGARRPAHSLKDVRTAHMIAAGFRAGMRARG